MGTCRCLVRAYSSTNIIDNYPAALTINYDMPGTCEAYLQRIGRSGKFGRKNVCINFIIYGEHLALTRF
jgi:superfamily II DNA/RNA helicase